MHLPLFSLEDNTEGQVTSCRAKLPMKWELDMGHVFWRTQVNEGTTRSAGSGAHSVSCQQFKFTKIVK